MYFIMYFVLQYLCQNLEMLLKCCWLFQVEDKQKQTFLKMMTQTLTLAFWLGLIMWCSSLLDILQYSSSQYSLLIHHTLMMCNKTTVINFDSDEYSMDNELQMLLTLLSLLAAVMPLCTGCARLQEINCSKEDNLHAHAQCTWMFMQCAFTGI